MAERRQIMIELDASDNVILERIAAHTRLPLVYIIRMALRHYAQTGSWPIGTNGFREQVLEEARRANGPLKGKVKP